MCIPVHGYQPAALLQIFKIPVRAVPLLCDSKNKATTNLEHLQHFDANGIIVHPCKLLIIVCM